MLGVAIIHGLKAAGYTRLSHLHPVWGEVSTGGHTVGGHVRAAHGFEAIVSIVGTHVALQSLGHGQAHQSHQEHCEQGCHDGDVRTVWE